jgi:hypothetical protein
MNGFDAFIERHIWGFVAGFFFGLLVVALRFAF